MPSERASLESDNLENAAIGDNYPSSTTESAGRDPDLSDGFISLPGCLATDGLAYIRVIGEQGVKQILLSDFAQPDRNLNRSRFESLSGAKYIISGSYLGLLVKLDLSSLHVTTLWSVTITDGTSLM